MRPTQLQTDCEQHHHYRQHPNEIRSISAHHTSPPASLAIPHIPVLLFSGWLVDTSPRYAKPGSQDSLQELSLSSRCATEMLPVGRIVGLIPETIPKTIQRAAQRRALTGRHLHADQDTAIGSTMIPVVKEGNAVIFTECSQKV